MILTGSEGTKDISYIRSALARLGKLRKMAPPPSSKALPITMLLFRLLTFVSLSVSLILIATNSATLRVYLTEVKVRFKNVYAYRYALACSVIGLAYTLLQIPFSVYHVSIGKRMIGNDGLLQFDFYGDKVISSLLATGVGASFGATIDLKKNLDDLVNALERNGILSLSHLASKFDHFFNIANVSAGFLLLGFLCVGASSVISSLALSKKG